MTRQEKLDILSKACGYARRNEMHETAKRLRLQILRIIFRGRHLK